MEALFKWVLQAGWKLVVYAIGYGLAEVGKLYFQGRIFKATRPGHSF